MPGAFVLAAALSAPAGGKTLCSAVVDAIDQMNGPDASNAQLDLSGATSCGSARERGGTAVYCYWEHPFRAETSQRQVDELDTGLRGCLGLPADGLADQSVNHPDTYDLRIYDREGIQISLSRKDKGALNRSLVFLRISSRPAP
ncbi:MAG: hypothetical protein AAF317_08340 [Pseudomonadota bacterium]